MKVKRWSLTVIFLGACLMMLGRLASAQRGGRLPIPVQPPSTQSSTMPDEPMPPSERVPNRKMLKASYEQLQKDVQHLSDLSTELKQEVAKSDENVLSLSGVKKAEEIEKLAKKIQGRMKNL